MTRTQHHPGARPPARRDSRRPGGTPPRTPGGSTTRTAPGDGRPPGSPGTGPRAGTGPSDSRPQNIPGPKETTTGAAHRSTGPGATTTSAGGTPTGTHGAPTGTRGASTATRTAVLTHAAAALSAAAPSDGATARPYTPVSGPAARGTASPATTPAAVPAQTPRRPLAPQPRPTDLFADLLLAVLSGQRPVHSMLRHTAGRAYDELARLAERGPLRTRGTRPVVRDIGYYVPRQGALEAFARIGAGDQLRAMAFRLEQGQDLRWRCTAVELGGPRAPRPDDD
ncbi:Rv3235 family protein [Streptomyces sp. NPDC005303]|uniref:Rv3235 family protein n=1 Tax=Streptomyces sp. NPDC005303 TaxID=3155713 RepID=UPI0033A9D601